MGYRFAGGVRGRPTACPFGKRMRSASLWTFGALVYMGQTCGPLLQSAVWRAGGAASPKPIAFVAGCAVCIATFAPWRPPAPGPDTSMAVPPSADGAAAVAAVVVDLTQDAAGPGVDADVQAPPAKKARTGDPIDADDQALIDTFSRTMESLCNAPMRPSAVDLHDALVGHDSLAPIRDALLSSSSSSSSGSGGPALEHLPLLAAHLEGSPDPLQHHVDAFLAMSNGGWAPDAVRDAIVKVADRKAHGCKKGGADVDVHASTDARYRWRWEVAQLDHIPGGLRPWVKRERGIDAAIRRVVQACEAAVRLGAAKRRDGLHTKLLRAMDALAKAQNDVEARIAQNASERADEIRRSIKKASVSQRKKAAEESVKNVEKSRSFMEAFLVRSSPAKARPQDERSGGGQVGMFMPFYLKEHTTLAPQRGSARTTDAPLRFNVQADVALHVAGRRRRRRHRPPVSTRKRLLQFHTDVRPPFVGRLARTSTVVGGRRPFARDPSLDYTVDSDDEWEQDDVEDADVITDDDDGVLSDDSDDRDVELRRDGLEDDGWLEPEGDVGDAGEPSAPAPAHDVNLRIIGPVQDVTLLAEPDREALGAFRRIVCADVVERLAAAASTTVPTPKKITKFFSSKARAVAV